MNGLQKGCLLAVAQLALLLSLGGKLLVDRATRPRAWVRALPVDPNLPVRGRYVSLRVEVPAPGVALPPVPPRPSYLRATDAWPNAWETHSVWVELVPTAAGLEACSLSPKGKGDPAQGTAAFIRESSCSLPPDQRTVTLRDPLAFFIPERVADPSRRLAGEDLWVEVTLPKKGLLRPIRLGVKKNGVLTPLEL